MVARKRDDGLYEVPGLSFAVPYEYVPDAHRPAPEEAYNQTHEAPQPEPDLRLADNSGYQNRTGQVIDLDAYEKQKNEAQAKSDAVTNLFEHPPTGEQLASYQRPKSAQPSVSKVALEPGPGEQTATGTRAARTPMDDAFAQQILRASRGTYTPGGDRMVAQQWLNQNEAVNPSERSARIPLTDPETGEPLMIPAQGAQPIYGKGSVAASIDKVMMPGYKSGSVPSQRNQDAAYEEPLPERVDLAPGETLTREEQLRELEEARRNPEVVARRTEKALDREKSPKNSQVVGWSPPVDEKPIIGTGAQEFANRQERQKMLEAQAAEQQQGAMRREARRDLNAGRYLQGAAEEEKADLDKARAEYDQQKAELDNVKVQVQQLAKTIPQIAQRMPPPRDTQSHFALAIAQGLMVAGGRPFVNLVQQAIDDDFRREQAMMHWSLEGQKVQLGALSTLAHLTAQTRDPVAAAHAFAALRWQQAQHQLEAFQVQAMGGRKSDEAQQMHEQMEVAKQHELKQMIGSVHTRQWATVPAQATGGGIPGVDRWIDQAFHDKKQAHAVKQHVYGQIAKGEPITMPTFDESGNITRTDQRIGEFSAGTAVRLPAWLDARQPVVHTMHPGEGAEARKAFDAAETGDMLLREAEGILKHAGARINPTTATQLDMVLTQLLSTAKNFDKDGTLKIAELPILEKRIGAHAIRNITSPADAQSIIDFSRKIMRKSAASQGGVSQMTMTPGGSDYWEKGATQQGKNYFRPYGGVVEGATEE